MKSKTIILLVISALMTISFGFVSVKPKNSKEAVSIEKNHKSFDHEANIGLLSEDKL